MRKAFVGVIGSCVALSGSAITIGATEANQTVIAPFVDNSAEQSNWIGAAVQASLLADLPHATAEKPDASASNQLAHVSGGRYLVTGGVQRTDSSVRLTAQLHDINGQIIGSAKESGDMRNLFALEDKLAFDLRDCMRTAEQSHRAKAPMPVIASAGPLKFSPQPLLPVGTIPVYYTNRTFREGNQRNIYNTPYFEYGGFGYGGYGLGGFGFGGLGFGGFGFGSASVGFATGGTGQGAY